MPSDSRSSTIQSLENYSSCLSMVESELRGYLRSVKAEEGPPRFSVDEEERRFESD